MAKKVLQNCHKATFFLFFLYKYISIDMIFFFKRIVLAVVHYIYIYISSTLMYIQICVMYMCTHLHTYIHTHVFFQFSITFILYIK